MPLFTDLSRRKRKFVQVEDSSSDATSETSEEDMSSFKLLNKKGKTTDQAPVSRIAERPPSREQPARQRMTDDKASKVLGAHVVPDKSSVIPSQKEERSASGSRLSFSRPRRSATGSQALKETEAPQLGARPPPVGHSYVPTSDGRWVLETDTGIALQCPSPQDEEIGQAITTNGVVNGFAPPGMAPIPEIRLPSQLKGEMTPSKADRLKLLRGSLSRLWILKAATADMNRDMVDGLVREGLITAEQEIALEDMMSMYIELINSINQSELCKEVDHEMAKFEGETLSNVACREALKISEAVDVKCEQFVHRFE